MLHFTKEKATKTCFEKQNARSAGKHIGQTVPEIFALTVQSAIIPHNRIFQIIRKSLSMLMFITFCLVNKREQM
jgi:hypothetical protein